MKINGLGKIFLQVSICFKIHIWTTGYIISISMSLCALHFKAQCQTQLLVLMHLYFWAKKYKCIWKTASAFNYRRSNIYLVVWSGFPYIPVLLPSIFFILLTTNSKQTQIQCILEFIFSSYSLQIDASRR